MSRDNSYGYGKSVMKHLDFILVDLLLIQLSFILSKCWYYYSYGGSIEFGSQYRQQALVLFVCFIVIVAFVNPYKNILKRDKWEEAGSTFNHTLSLALIDIVLMFIMHDTDNMSRLTFVMCWVIYFFLELGFRLVWKRIIRVRFLKHNKALSQVIVVTTSDRYSLLENNIGRYLFRNYEIVGVFLSDFSTSNKNQDDSFPIIGGIEEMIDYTTHNWVDEVIVDVPNNKELNGRFDDLFLSMGIPTHHTIGLVDSENGNGISYVNRIGNYIVITNKTREISPVDVACKRLLDIVGGLVGSVITVFVLIIVGPIIKIQSPGPIIFAQTRVGKNGQTFKMYKIRSMYMDAEERKKALMDQNKMDGFMFKMDDDPRIIGSQKKDKNGKPKGIGNFIRKTSLDEFPQFFNVLKGQMSLVGTRPPTVDEWEKYSPEHRKRLAIKPGITGLWQISGRSDITDFDEVVRLDSEYIDTWTIGMDIRILFKTFGKVVKHEGAE